MMPKSILAAVTLGVTAGAIIPVGLAMPDEPQPPAFNVVNEDQSSIMRDCIEGPGRPLAIWQDDTQTATWWATSVERNATRHGMHGHILVSCNTIEPAHNTY